MCMYQTLVFSLLELYHVLVLALIIFTYQDGRGSSVFYAPEAKLQFCTLKTTTARKH